MRERGSVERVEGPSRRGVGGGASRPVRVPIHRVESPPEEGEKRGVYVISVAARLLNMHPQTLRKYERLGLVSPSRTEGMLRLYSEEDIARLRLIKYLVEEVGMNLAGVELTLQMLSRLADLRRRLRAMAEGMAEGRGLISQVERELDRLFSLFEELP